VKMGIDDYLVRQADPAAALRGLLEDAIPADPIARADRCSTAADPGADAVALLRDLSFAAAVRVGGAGVLDVVAQRLRKAAGINKSAVAEAVHQFERLMSRPTAGGANPGVAEEKVPPELQAEAEALLKDPKLVQRFHETLEGRGLVGERDAALALLLCTVSRKMAKPINTVIKAASSAGKNYLVDSVIALVPPADVMVLSDMTPRALNYLEGGFKNKVVVIVEQAGAAAAEYPLRVAMSEGRITTLVAEKVEKGGSSRIETRRHDVEGPAAFILTTTRGLLHDENETRIIEVNVDESPKQTEQILEALATRAAEPEPAEDRERALHERDVWRVALGVLDGRAVVVTQARDLVQAFPKTRVRARRDFGKLLALIQAHALLHQRQRPTDDEGRVLATNDDVQVALRLGQVLREDLSPRLRSAGIALREAFNVREFTPTEAAKVLGYVDDAARRLLRELERVGVVELTSTQRGSSASRWKMVVSGVGPGDAPSPVVPPRRGTAG
jgi:fructose-specific phosphotransferase system component IIB